MNTQVEVHEGGLFGSNFLNMTLETQKDKSIK